MPELGEEEPPQIDIVKLGTMFIEEKYQVSDRHDELKAALENPNSKQAENYKYKQSREFYEPLQTHLEQLKARLYSAEIKLDNYHISAAEIKCFVDQQSEKSLVELIQEITKLLSKRVSEISRESFAKTLEQLFKKRLNTIGSLSDYYHFLATNHLEHASEKNRINYSDLFPIYSSN